MYFRVPECAAELVTCLLGCVAQFCAQLAAHPFLQTSDNPCCVTLERVFAVPISIPHPSLCRVSQDQTHDYGCQRLPCLRNYRPDYAAFCLVCIIGNGYITVKKSYYLKVRHPRCVGSVTKNFVYYTYSQTQLYFTYQYSKNTITFSILYVGHLQVEIFNLQISYRRCVGRLCGRGRGRDLVSTVGTVTPSCQKWIFSSFCLCTHSVLKVHKHFLFLNRAIFMYYMLMYQQNCT